MKRIYEETWGEKIGEHKLRVENNRRRRNRRRMK